VDSNRNSSYRSLSRAYKAKGKGAYEKEGRGGFREDLQGKAFESEIRERFQLPRTTTWRLIKRLEKEGIIEVRKVGGRDLVG